MTDFMSIDQIISAAKNDINGKIGDGLFTGQEDTTNDDQENFYTIESLYCQWAKRGEENNAGLKIWEMFEEDYPEYF